MRINPTALTAWREERGLRKTDLAGACHISLGYLCDLESGRKPGSPQVIRKLADHLAVNVRVLIQNPNEAAA